NRESYTGMRRPTSSAVVTAGIERKPVSWKEVICSALRSVARSPDRTDSLLADDTGASLTFSPRCTKWCSPVGTHARPRMSRGKKPLAAIDHRLQSTARIRRGKQDLWNRSLVTFDTARIRRDGERAPAGTSTAPCDRNTALLCSVFCTSF